MKNYFAIIMMSLFSMFAFGIDIPDLKGQALSLTFTDSLSGKLIDLDDYIGNPVFIHFWYSSCPPCEEKMTEIISLHEEYSVKGVSFIGINFDPYLDDLLSFCNSKNINWPQKHDSANGSDRSFAFSNNIKMFPAFILVDENGIVQKSSISLTLIRRALSSLMEE